MSRSLNVLLVEDNPGDAALVRLQLEMLEGFTTRLHTTVRMSDAVLRVSEGDIDLVLLDLSLPDSHGIESVQRIRAEAPTLPVVILTGQEGETIADQAIEAGAQDYLVKGSITTAQLARAMRWAVARQRIVDEQSLQDELTGLKNRRGFMLLAEQALQVAKRNRQPLTVVFVDLDRMKHINDTWGHQEGDRAIRAVAGMLRQRVRSSDIVARLGGDEFCMLLHSSQPTILLRRILRTVVDHNRSTTDPYSISISLGMSKLDPAQPRTLEELMQAADDHMYKRKLRRHHVRSRGELANRRAAA